MQEWRTADRNAAHAERELVRKALSGEDPASGEAEAAKSLRGIANDLFAVAMEEMEASRRRLAR